MEGTPHEVRPLQSTRAAYPIYTLTRSTGETQMIRLEAQTNDTTFSPIDEDGGPAISPPLSLTHTKRCLHLQRGWNTKKPKQMTQLPT